MKKEYIFYIILGLVFILLGVIYVFSGSKSIKDSPSAISDQTKNSQKTEPKTSSEEQKIIENNDGDLDNAILSSDVIKVRKLIKAGTDVNAVNDYYGRTPLILACTKNSIEIVQELIKAGADVNAKDSLHELTALMYASDYGEKEIVQELIKAGADVNIVGGDGRTALTFASTYPEIVKLLQEQGAKR